MESLYGELGIIAMRGCEKFVDAVDNYLKEWRRHDDDKDFIMHVDCPRFSSGEAKALLKESARGHDIYIISDCFNYGQEYKMYGKMVPMSPDDHFADLKRVIAAIEGKASRISVIMPMLYEGRQHKRTSRESLDCAMALQELVQMGVSNIITFDAHDPRVQNAIPLSGFDNIRPSYQMLKALVKEYPDISLGKDDIAFISPDEGAMSRSMYFSSLLGVDLGMFYKRRNYTIIVDGKNPIEAHEYLGKSVEGKDVVVVDDMIASGESCLDVFEQLKERGARRVFMFATFGLFTNGPEVFDKAYEKGLFDKVFTTNLIYTNPDVLERPWYSSVNMCKYVAYIIDTLNHDQSISTLLNPVGRIHKLLDKQADKNAKQLTIGE
ncbi:MAG: ribose-phosphate pyrophosphokinase [Ruminococcaceae bacterium]|nr:ribose-phosphate pyrophosphokinase [Oscillospiraceae bacterium]